MRTSLLFLITTYFSFGQNIGRVCDPKNNPISYVNIWVENEQNGATSDENGNFIINTEDKNKVLIFTALGFETTKVKIADCQKVIMKNVVYQLEQVTISSPTKKELIEVGNYKKKEISSVIGCGKDPYIIAKKFSNTEEIEKHPNIKELVFQTKSKIKKAKIQLHFYEVNEDGSPGKEMLTENYFIECKKGTNENRINIEKCKLVFQNNGIFIGFEWMIIETNKYTYDYFKEEEESKILHKDGVGYEPMIGTVASDTNTTWRFASGKWRGNLGKASGERFKIYNNKFYELAANLILTN